MSRTINKDRQKHLSRFLSLVLRHQPEKIGLTLDEHGWAHVNQLIMLMNQHKKTINKDILASIVSGCDKQRFSFSDDQLMIRANQGHSIAVDLGYQKQRTEDVPDKLYHGTSENNAKSILQSGGIQKQKRHHVHLSADLQTARAVGRRHGKLAVFEIDTRAMLDNGHEFYKSANGVWLTHEVPVQYISYINRQG